jgi:hypothetical protein
MNILIFSFVALLTTTLSAHSAITTDDAVEIVWKTLGQSPGNNSFLFFDREDQRNGKNYFVLQGYNRVYDPIDGTSHTSTWGWFYVDSKTGEPFLLDFAEDTLEKLPTRHSSSAPTNSPPQSLYDFLDSWFACTSSNDANLVIGHYADQVAYCYSKGITSRAKLVQGQLQFTSKFPNRRYTDWNVGRIQPDGSGGYDIDYSFRYSYTGTKNANGRSNVSISVRQFGGEWKITRFDETTSKL